MKISKRQLRKTIRKVITESVGKYTELAKMLVSNDEISIKQAIELGETMGFLKLEDTFRKEVKKDGFNKRRKNRYEMVHCLTVEPALEEALQAAEDSRRGYGDPMRMSTYSAGYKGGVWIFCDVD